MYTWFSHLNDKTIDFECAKKIVVCLPTEKNQLAQENSKIEHLHRADEDDG